MKTIGLIGGMSWESSIGYYRIINEATKASLGGLHSSRSLMYSVDFSEVEALQHAGLWDEAAEMMIEAALRLQRGGADCVVLCTNTMHKLASQIETAIEIPFLHIADATADRVRSAGVKTVGLLGTKFTMEQDFYRGRLEAKHDLNVIVPNDEDRDSIHRIIYEELCLGIINEDSRSQYIDIINKLVAYGVDGVILGCTEIELLVPPDERIHTLDGIGLVPLFATTRIHAESAVQWALQH